MHAKTRYATSLMLPPFAALLRLAIRYDVDARISLIFAASFDCCRRTVATPLCYATIRRLR